MNTEWWIGTAGPADLDAAEEAVHAAERRFSRFLPDSAVSRLNRDRRCRDAALAGIVRRALEMHAATDGAFDVRVGAAMNAAGYDRSFELLASGATRTLTFAPPLAALRIMLGGDLDDDEVRLDGSGTIDLGGIAKGWTVDRVAEAIERGGCRDYVVDGGGDIRASGRDERGAPWVVGVGDGLAVRLADAAVCTSSTRRRRWPAGGATELRGADAHHVIDPATGAPARHAIVECAVVARDATLADVHATTLIADPARGLAALSTARAEALFLRDGHWEMTAGMEQWLI